MHDLDRTLLEPELEDDLDELEFEHDDEDDLEAGTFAGRMGRRTGRWIRRGPRLILLDV